MSTSVILFLAANPNGTSRVALDEECAAIERELRMTTGRDDFDFRSKWAVSIDEMMRHLNELQPTIVHFSGHGGGSADVCLQDQPHRDIDMLAPAGIQLQGEQRQPQHVSADALSQMIRSAAPSARLVVLNACFSDAVAEALRSSIDCVVGMRGAIGDAAARSFAVGFYRALGYRRPIGNAFAQAKAALAGKDLTGYAQPQCLARSGIDVETLVLHGGPPRDAPPQVASPHRTIGRLSHTWVTDTPKGMSIGLRVENNGHSGFWIERYRWQAEWDSSFNEVLAKAGITIPTNYVPPAGEVKFGESVLVKPDGKFEFEFVWSRDDGLAHLKTADIGLQGFSASWANYRFEIPCRGELGEEKTLSVIARPHR